MSKTQDLGIDRWLFVLGLSILGSMLAWQLVNVDEPTGSPTSLRTKAPIPQPPLEKPDYQRIENSLYSDEQLDYFFKIAFQSEHIQLQPLVRKWTKDIVIRVEGDATGEDLKAVKRTVDLLNKLQGQVKLSIGMFAANLVIHFRPEPDFPDVTARYQPYNRGFFWVRWIEEEIYHATVLIDSASTTQDERNALILEELTQSLGLMNASTAHDASIFNDAKEITAMTLSPLDRALVTMLYQKEVLPGMAPQEALQVLANLPAESKD